MRYGYIGKGVLCWTPFLTGMGILHYNCHSGYIASVFYEDELTSVHPPTVLFSFRIKTSGDPERHCLSDYPQAA